MLNVAKWHCGKVADLKADLKGREIRNLLSPYIHSVVDLWKTEKNSSKYLDYMAKSCKFALKKVAKSCKTVSKNIAKSCNYA
jgi:hypothetical protein